jgi:hypothetical protein
MSKFIGVVRNAITGQVLAVINPDDDAELDNPRHLLLKSGSSDPVEMIKMPRGEYMGAISTDQLAELVARVGRR